MSASLAGCKDSTPAASNTLQITAAPGRGFLKRVFTDSEGNPHKYVLFVPHIYTVGSKPPVLMFLNGLGENGDDGIRQISNNFGIQAWESREFFPFLAIAPQCRKEGAWQPGHPDVTWAMQILDDVIREFGADPDRVYLTGVSSGGSGVWHVGSSFPERFAAVVPLAGGSGNPQRLAESRMAVWDFYNDGDEKSLVEWNRRTRKLLIEQGCSPIITEYGAPGHDCWNRAYRTTAMFAWLQEQRRSQNAKAEAFKYLTPENLLKSWRKSGASEWMSASRDTDDILVARGGAPAGRLVSDTASTSLELHGDAWLSNSEHCRVAIVPDKEPDRIAFLISIVPAKHGTGGIVNDNGEQLVQLDPGAQRTLRVAAWNDVRVELSAGRLKVRLNGWPAADLKLDNSNSGTAYRCAIVAREGGETRWRFIRTRMGAQAPK